MGEKWDVEKVEIVNGCLIQIDIKNRKTGQVIRFFGDEILEKISKAMTNVENKFMDEYFEKHTDDQ